MQRTTHGNQWTTCEQRVDMALLEVRRGDTHVTRGGDIQFTPSTRERGDTQFTQTVITNHQR